MQTGLVIFRGADLPLDISSCYKVVQSLGKARNKGVWHSPQLKQSTLLWLLYSRVNMAPAIDW